MRRFVPPVRRRASVCCLVSALLALLGVGVTDVSAQQPYVDPNVNMVKGTVWPLGDPYLQRQNEPSIAVSTRNPCHLVAGANDYRSVDVPFDDTIPPNSENSLSLAGDAWLGLFKSFDCGAKWQSTLLPGYPQDPSTLAPELKGHAAGADPTVRAGTNGLFYYSGMVFNRGTQGTSKIFVSRLIDNNDKERGDPIQFLDVSIIDTGTKGQFLDKPWMAVDVPRSGYGPGSVLGGGATCQVNGKTLPAGNVYMAWAKFTGNGNQHSKLMFAKSSDCGKTFKQHPISNNQTLSQGANIAIAPHDGTIYLTWREFASTKNNNKPVNFWIVTSSNGGESFTAPKMIGSNITTFDQLRSTGTFRSNALPAITADHQNRVYVAWSARGAAKYYDTNKVLKSSDDARIMMVSSSDRGKTWSPPFPIDPNLARGHQMMPSLTFAAGKLQAIWYDAREDVSGIWNSFIDDRQATSLLHTIDVRGAQATPAAMPVFVGANSLSLEISKYRQWNLEIKDAVGNVTGYNSIEIGSNPPNLPMYANGTTPFIGDYIDVSGLPSFPVQTTSGQVWQPNIGPINLVGASAANLSTSGFPTLPIFHATWTDNRDVRIEQCVADPNNPMAQMVGQRNANIYTARLTPGLFVGSPGNTKPLGIRPGTEKDPQPELIQRGFVVFAQNTTKTLKFFRFKIATQPQGGHASFRQFDGNHPALDEVIVSIPPASTVARTVYATSTDEQAQLLVNVEEMIHDAGKPVLDSNGLPVLENGVTKKMYTWSDLAGGLSGSVLLNPDRTNPPIQDPDVDSEIPQIATDEVHDPSMFDAQFYKRKSKSRQLDVLNARTPDPENPDPENPDPENPDPENPDPENPDPENPDPENPDPENPDPENPDPENPDPENPDPENALLENSSISDLELQNATITDIAWRVHNSGNTTSAYKFRPSLPKTFSDQRYQLIVTRRSMALALGPDCKPIYKSSNQVLVNIQKFDPTNPDPENPDPENPDPENPDPENPDPENPDPENANFFLAPDETATVTLRVFDLDPANDTTAPPPSTRKEVAAKTAAQAANTGETTVTTAVAGPDLTLRDDPSSIGPAIVRPGHAASVTFTLRNRGTGAAFGKLTGTTTYDPIKTRVYRSADTTLDAGDLPVTTIEKPTPPLSGFTHCTGTNEAECSTTSTVSVPMPTDPGQYYVIVVTDEDGDVFEADELNNRLTLSTRVENYQLTITSQPSSTTQDFTMTPALQVAISHPDLLPVPISDVAGVTVAIQNNPSVGTLAGTLLASNAGGLASFGDLKINDVGNGYTLAVTALYANGAVSAPFNIETDLAPVVANDSYTTNEEQVLAPSAPGVLTNDSDPPTKGLKPLSYVFDSVKLADPANGTVAVNPNGSFSYTPNTNFAGTDTFTYHARDGRPGNLTMGTVTVTVVNVNDAPSFTKGADQTVLEDAGLQTVTPWATGISPGPMGEASQSVDFIVTNSNTALFSSQPAIAPNGTLTYTSALNANGVATVTVMAHDNGGTASGGVDTSASQTFTITVTAVNDPPNYTKGADQTVNEDSGAHSVPNWATGITAGPPDEAGQILTFTVLNPSNPALFAVQPAIAANGTLTYTPAPNAVGTANILIQLADNGGGTNLGPASSFNITVSPVNDAPSFTAGANQSVAEDSGAQSEPGWAVNISAGPTNESSQVVDFIVTNSNTALFSSQPAIAPNGTLTYAGAANANGTATVTVRVHDNGGTANSGVDTSAPQTFTITLTPVNDPPVSAADAYATNEDAPLTIDASGGNGLLANDTDVDGAAPGIAEYLTTTTNGTLLPHANGSFSYTPNANLFGSDSFTYRASDGGTTGNTVTVTITVNSVNDVPSFTKGVDQTATMNTGAQSVPGWATGLGAGPANESGQLLDFIVTNDNSAIFAIAPSITAAGTLSYTPSTTVAGIATVTVRIHDNGGTANGGVDTSAAQTFTITVTNTPTTFVVTTTADSGAGSLRQAILNANANASADTITFNIPGSGVRTITPVTALPQVVYPVVIDATTQPGFGGTPIVELNGASAGATAVGFNVYSQNVTIRGFIVNRFQQIGISLTTANNTVVGNYVGTDASGTTALGNFLGVFASVGPNLIGGSTAADRNVISGNTDNGLTIQKYTGPGVSVKGNYIGTNAAGTAAVANAKHGVYLVSVSAAQIGGDAAGEGNVISGNGETGVQIFSCETPGACGTLVVGNKIGTNAAGTAAIPNGLRGIDINLSPNNTIRGNLISGNGIAGTPGGINAGVHINSELLSVDPQAELLYGNHVIVGNKIGTDITGMAPIPNLTFGIVLSRDTKTRIGGTDAVDRNIVAYNGNSGVHVGYTGSSNNTIVGNYIGVNANLQPAGNQGAGVFITNGSSGNTVSGNVIGSNLAGVAMNYGQQNNNTITGNFIGTDSAGTLNLGNSGHGVTVTGNNNVISQNRIANNAGAGLWVRLADQIPSPQSIGNRLSQNYIFNNGQLGIDLAANGVTANDPGDGDADVNGLQNFPVVSGAFINGGVATILGSLNSAPSSTYTIEFFSSAAADASDYGEGQTYLGSLSVTTDAAGNAGIATTLTVTPGQVVTATATDAAGNTSEFSQARVAVANTPPSATNDDILTVTDFAMTTNPGANDVDPDVAAPEVRTTYKPVAGFGPLLGPGNVAVVTSTGRGYFTGGNQSQGTTGKIGILDLATNTVVGTIPLPGNFGAGFTEVDQAAQVVFFRGGINLLAVDASPASLSFNQLVLNINLGTINSWALDQTQHRLYVTTQTTGAGLIANGRVAVIDTDRGSVNFLKMIAEAAVPSLNGTATALDVNTVTNKLYVAVTGGAPGLYAVDPVTLAMTQIFSSSGLGNVTSIAINDVDNLIYAAGQTLLHAVDGTNDTKVGQVALGGNASAGSIDSRVVIHRVTGRVYVRLGSFPNPSNLVVVDGKRGSSTINTVVATINLGRENGAFMALDESVNRLLATSASDLRSHIIDTTNNTIVGTIMATQTMGRVSLDQTTHRAYLTGGSAYIKIVDVAAAALVTDVHVGTQVWGMAVDPFTHSAYVSETGLVTAIKKLNETGISGTIALNHGDGREVYMARNSVTNKIYALNSGATVAGGSDALPGFVHVIDGNTNAVTANIAVGPLPFGVAIDEVNNKIYVGNGTQGASFQGGISIIDGVTNAVVAANVSAIPSTSNPANVAIGRDMVVTNSGRLYFRVTGGAATQMLGTLNGTVATPINLGNFNINLIRYNRTTDRLYVGATAFGSSGNNGANQIFVIDPSTNAVVTTLNLGWPSDFVTTQSYVAVNAVTNRVFISNFDEMRLDVVDGTTHAVVATIPMPFGPSTVAVDEVHNRIYVGNAIDRSLTIVDGATLRVARTLALPIAPVELFVDSSLSPARIFARATENEGAISVIDDPGTAAPQITSVTNGAHGTVVLNADGSVTYTPTTGYVGNDSYTYTTTDGQGGSTTSTANVTVYAEMSIQPATLANGLVGQNYSQTLTATGGSASPRVWTVQGSSLPGGLHLSSSGVLSGTLQQSGDFSFTVQAYDTGQPLLTESRNYTVIVGPPVITPTGVASGTVNVPYSQQLFAGGATGAVTWSLDTSSHPALAWLTIDQNGVLNGTPATYGTTPSFTVTATDSAPTPQSASRSYTIFVNGPLTMADLREGVVLETEPSVSFLGGNGTRALTMTDGALPPGIVLGTGGVFTGTPTRHGTYNFTLELQDCLNSSCNASIAQQTVNKDIAWRVSAKDQQGSSTTGGSPITFGGSPNRKLAQVFTVGAHGQLTAIGLQGVSCPVTQTTVTVDIQRLTTDGLPDGTTIATGSAQTNFNAIALSTAVPVAIGERLAFIASVVAPLTCNFTNAPAGVDQYNAGEAYTQTTGGWTRLADADLDNNGAPDGFYDITSFRTLIMPAMDVTYMPASHGGNTVTLLNNGKVLIAGHSNSTNAEIYDPATGLTTATGQMSMVRQHATATLLGDGTVLIAGGTDQNGNKNAQAEIFDPNGNGGVGAFTPTNGNMSNARDQHRAVRYVVASVEKVLITGGMNSVGTTLAAVEIYDPVAKTFSMTNNNLLARQAHAAVLLNTGKILLAGGYTSGSGPNAELFNPATNTWTATGNFSGSVGNMIVNSRGQLTATELSDGRVLIAGGQSGDVRNEAETYNPATGQFTAVGNMSTTRYQHTATLLTDGTVLIAGGFANQAISSHTLPLATMERFDPATNTFVPAGSMETRRANFAAGRLSSGKVLLAGGFSQSWMTGNTGELFDVATTPYFTPTTAANAPLGVPYAEVFNGHGGSGGPYTFAFAGGQLPPGLSYNDGTVAGTPITAGIYQFAIAVTDNGSHTALQSVSLTVGSVNTITSPYRLPDAPQGAAYTYQLQATGTGNTWTVLPTTSTTSTSNPLPPGITLSSSGLLEGTPTVTNYYNFGVRAIDASGVEATKVLSISVQSPLQITTTSLGNPELFNSLNCINTSNGTGTKTYSIVAGSGALPSGVTFNGTTTSSCVSFTGQPKQTGTFTFRVRITDQSFIPQTAEQTYTINVYAADQQSFGGPTTFSFGAGTGTMLAERVITGITGTLRGVRMQNLACTTNGTSVSVQIQGLDPAGKPNGTVLATGSGVSPLGTVYLNSGVFFDADQPFAIVFDASAPCTLRPSSFDSYPGDGFISNGGGAWQRVQDVDPTRYDVPFTSIVEPVSGVGGMNTSRGNFTATLLNNGLVLLAGGDCCAANNTGELLDPATNTTTATANTMTTRSGHAAVLLNNGKVLLAGGRNSSGTLLSSAELFDPSNNTFAPAGSMISARENFRMTLLDGVDGKVLITGGWSGSATLFNAELYDGAFTALPNMNRSRQSHTATKLSDGSVLLAGGYGTGNGSLAEIYNPTSQTFTPTTGNMTSFRARHTATPIAGGLVLLAGGTGNSGEALAATEVFNPASGGSFTAGPEMSLPRVDHTAVKLGDGSVLLSGGYSDTTCCYPHPPTATMQRYVPGTGLVGAPSMLVERYAHTATLTADDKVVFAGTFGWSSAAGRTTEVFDPSAAPYLQVTESSAPSGTPYSFTFAPAGGSGSGYVMTLKSGSLSNELTLNLGQANNHISGTPTQSGTYYLTIEVLDGAGHKSYQLFTLRIDPVTITTESLPIAYGGVAYTGALSGTATTSITWTVIGGSLPPGLSLNPNTGAFTGSSTFSCCSYTFTVRATDGLGQSTIKTLTITLQQALAINTTSLGDAWAGSIYYGNLFASGGTQPYHWSLSGNVPSNLIIDPVTGSFDTTYPARIFRQAGTFSFNGNVTDSATPQQSASRAYTLNVWAQDQSTGGNTAEDVVLAPTRRVAQVFKSATPYDLGGIQPWSMTCDAGVVMTAQVFPVTAGLVPDESGGAFSSGTLTSNAAGYFPSSNLIFSPAVPMAPGTSFAVVFSADGNCKVSYWADQDYYSRGDAWVSDNNGIWTLADTVLERRDIPMSTLLLPPLSSSLRFLAGYRGGHVTARLNDGRVLIAGQEQSTELYDPTSNTLTPTADMSHWRQDATATVLANGKVLIAGGAYWDTNTTTYHAAATTQIFNPATGLFEASQNMSSPRSQHTATLLNNGNVLIAGGQTFNGSFWEPVQSADLFDGSGNFISSVNMTGARSQHTATLLNNEKVLIVGGWAGSPNPPGVAELYDPGTGSFSSISGSINWPSQHTATLVTVGPHAGQVLIAGGNGYPTLGDSYFFEPLTNVFLAAPSLLTKRLDHTATALPNGRIVFTGGVIETQFYTSTSSIEVYDPVTDERVYAGNLITDRQGHSADLVSTPGGVRVAVSGGWGSSNITSRSMELIDLGPLDGESGSFASATPMTQARRGHVAVQLDNGTVLLAGSDELNVPGAELYNPATNTTLATGNLINARCYGCAYTKLPNGKVLVTGGWNGGSVFNTGELYDPGTGSFSATTGNMTAPRVEHSSVLLDNGKVLILGGYDGTTTYWSAELFDPATGTFAATGSMASARYRATAIKLQNGKVLVVGGLVTPSNNFVATAELYDPVAGTFSATGSMVTPRYTEVPVLLNDGRVLIAGGGANGSVLASAEVYNPSIGTWSVVGSMTTHRIGHFAVKLPNGAVVVGGGNDETNAFLNSAEVFEPLTNTFTRIANLPSARANVKAILLGDGRIMLTGGTTSAGRVATVEYYVP